MATGRLSWVTALRMEDSGKPQITRGRIDTFSFSMLDLFDHGAVAQLGERLNGIQEADGSIPFSSTHCSLFLSRRENFPREKESNLCRT